MPQQPHTWTATTAQEALNILDAARKTIEAHMLALVPGDSSDRWKAQQDAPVHLTIALDDIALSEMVTARHAPRNGGAL
ncbi:hypothetical protein [Streptomyces zaomyceticus]|uniref:Uncharacterized protein n=1 Tax=Streptomyces zaomyceticus TaxID=68286 RepID=A0ABZ1LR60_9ACTN|nr:hypothetical protein OG237_42275 [Streptomyces zaomyceticus]